MSRTKQEVETTVLSIRMPPAAVEMLELLSSVDNADSVSEYARQILIDEIDKRVKRFAEIIDHETEVK